MQDYKFNAITYFLFSDFIQAKSKWAFCAQFNLRRIETACRITPHWRGSRQLFHSQYFFAWQRIVCLRRQVSIIPKDKSSIKCLKWTKCVKVHNENVFWYCVTAFDLVPSSFTFPWHINIFSWQFVSILKKRHFKLLLSTVPLYPGYSIP